MPQQTRLEPNRTVTLDESSLLGFDQLSSVISDSPTEPGNEDHLQRAGRLLSKIGNGEVA